MSTSADFDKELNAYEQGIKPKRKKTNMGFVGHIDAGKTNISAEVAERIVILERGRTIKTPPPQRTITQVMSDQEKFDRYKYGHNQISKRLFYPAPIYTYGQFKAEYELIQQKQSKLSSAIRKEIESVWVSLYGNAPSTPL